MGFTKWLLKNGPGSIGKTTKTCVQAHKDALKNQDEKDDEVRVASFTHVIYAYTIATKFIQPNYKPIDTDLLLEASKGCLAMLCWVLICDDFKTVEAVWGSQKHFDASTEAVYETTLESSKNSVRLSYSEFRFYAFEYICFKVDAYGYSIENSGIIVPTVSYQTIIYNKQTKKTEVFKNDFLDIAKEEFNRLSRRPNVYIYYIFTVEINDGKYKFVHYCNDDSYKVSLNKELKKPNGMFSVLKFDN